MIKILFAAVFALTAFTHPPNAAADTGHEPNDWKEHDSTAPAGTQSIAPVIDVTDTNDFGDIYFDGKARGASPLDRRPGVLDEPAGKGLDDVLHAFRGDYLKGTVMLWEKNLFSWRDLQRRPANA